MQVSMRFYRHRVMVKNFEKYDVISGCGLKTSSTVVLGCNQIVEQYDNGININSDKYFDSNWRKYERSQIWASESVWDGPWMRNSHSKCVRLDNYASERAVVQWHYNDHNQAKQLFVVTNCDHLLIWWLNSWWPWSRYTIRSSPYKPHTGIPAALATPSEKGAVSVNIMTVHQLFSERELMFMFAICRRPSVCLYVCLSSVTFVHPTQAIEIFRNVSTPFGTLAICDPSVKILRRSSQGNRSVGGLNQRGVEKCRTFPRLYLGNGAR